MNTTVKVGLGVAAGLVIGTMLVGTAFAAPLLGARTAGGGMMRFRSTESAVSVSQMLSFMERYRTPDGRIDMGRMHADVTGGKVKAPCGSASGATTDTPSVKRAPSGTGMMGGSTSGVSGMMGGWY